MIVSLVLFIFLLRLFERHVWIAIVFAGAALAVPVICFLISFITHKRNYTKPTELPPPRDYAKYLEQAEDEDSE